MTIEFTIPIDPVAKGRPRISTVHGRPIAFTPKETKLGERAMAAFAREAMQGKELLSGALVVRIGFWLRKPKSVKREHPTTKPDLDNYIKMMDAFNGIIWEDDSQIIGIEASKAYCLPNCEPSIYIQVCQVMTAEENGHKKNTLRGKGAKK